MIANHGQSRQYYHDIVGCNSRLDSIQAAILDIKLKHLDEYISARKEAADHYDNAFANHPGIVTPYRADFGSHVFHQYTIQVDPSKRDGLKEYLSTKQIPSMIYYPVPGHKQKMFEQFGVESAELPVTDALTQRVISLPIHTELDSEQLKYISREVLAFLNN